MDGRVALVTGAASGMGRATVLAFVREGARVVVGDVNDAGADETVALAREAGGEAEYIRCDVSRPDEVEALVRRTVEAFGRLDYLNFQGRFSSESTLLNAGIVIAILPILLVYILLQRYIVSGLTAGALKD